MQRPQIRQLLEKRNRIFLAFLADPAEKLAVYNDALEVRQALGQAVEETWRVAEAEELESQAFDCEWD